MSFLTKIFGDPNAKVVVSIKPIIEKINSLESSLEKLSLDGLLGKTFEFKDRLQKGETQKSCNANNPTTIFPKTILEN